MKVYIDAKVNEALTGRQANWETRSEERLESYVTKIRKFLNHRARALHVAAVTLPLTLMSTAAMAYDPADASADKTFNSFTGELTKWLEGSLGVLFGLGGVIFAIMQAFQGRWGGVGIGFGVALLAAFGPAVATSIVGATI